MASGTSQPAGAPAPPDQPSPVRDDASASREGYLLVEPIRDDADRIVDLVYLEANRAAARLTGVRDLVGRRASETEPEALGVWLEAWERVLRTGDPEGLEVWSEAAGRWFDTYLSSVDGPNGRRGVVIFHDITARRAAEAALRDREARLVLALAIGDVGTWSWDLQAGTGEIDARGAEIVGLTPGDLDDVAAAQRASIHPDDRERVGRDIAAGIASGRVFTLDYRVTHPDGTIHIVSSRAQVLLDEAGQPRTLLGTNRDVTAERQIEMSLREREERYRTLFESMDEGFCILEMVLDDGVPVDYRFIEVNPVFERQTGLRDAVGRTARELVADLEPSWVEVYGRVALTGEPIRFTSHAPSMGRWFEVYAFRIGTPEQLRVALLFNDITHRVKAEEEREALLERERMARTAAEAFLAVMSHELRTPITSIYGRATLLARNPGRDDVQELVTDMLDEAEQLRRIVDDLLVLSGIDRGHLPLAPEPILVQHAIGEVLADARRRFPDVAFQTQLDRAVPPVTADNTALRQVLYNLVSNAAKYAGRDGPVTITAAESGDTVEVAVLDEGPGVGDDPDALFTLFFRSPHTAKRASGTGIGLYVARELLRAMDATVDAGTRPTGGAAFRVRLRKALED